VLLIGGSHLVESLVQLLHRMVSRREPMRHQETIPNGGPDFFIVGAPKSGTSALDQYLREHPAIFMAPKERHFFASDLSFRARRPSAAEYFSLFPPNGAFERRGDASVWYLYSGRAAEEIHAYNTRAKIIAMLRNPVDMLYSMHSQLLYTGGEDIADFGEALAAEGDRREGRRIPAGSGLPFSLAYRQVARYSEQLKRYFGVFGRDQVHVILFDDFQADPPEAYRRVLKFLEIDSSFNPAFEVVNANKHVRSEIVRGVATSLKRPPRPLRRLGRTLIRSRTARDRVDRVRSRVTLAVTSAIERANTAVEPRAPMDPRLHATLRREFAPDILSLAELLGRNLDHWVAPEIQKGGTDRPASDARHCS
jgi:hypothetical protein